MAYLRKIVKKKSCVKINFNENLSTSALTDLNARILSIKDGKCKILIYKSLTFNFFKDTKCEIIENVMNFLEDELDIRIESLKIGLDFAHEKLIEEFEFHVSELIKNNYKLIVNRKNLKRMDRWNQFISLKNKEIVNLLKVDEKFELNFIAKSTLINSHDVGLLCWSKQPKLEKLNFEASFKRLNLKLTEKENVYKLTPYFRSLCGLNRAFILLSDYKNNEILMFDSDFNFKELYTIIDNDILDRPCSMCTNDLGSLIYLINFGNQEMFLTNSKLSAIERKLTKLDFGELFFPVDCTFFKKNIYLIDHGYYRVLKLSEKGDLEKEFLLFNSEPKENNDYLVWPLKIQVTYNIIAVLDDWSYIYVYDFNGELKQIISDRAVYSPATKRANLPEDSDIQTFIILESYLLFHSSNGSISVFIEQRDKFVFLMKKYFCGLDVKYTHFCYFNGQLIMTIKDDKRIVLI